MKEKSCDLVDESSNAGEFSDIICPSEECWSYDSTINKCVVKQDGGCSSVICGPKHMTISINGNVFGVSNTIDGITPNVFGDTLTLTNPTDRYTVSCPLGGCGMNHYIEMDR